jgi:pyruvate/2-oxoglutarate dehydrogenase complex dihydrolipoamide acyltransferase (E2) component
MKRITDSLRKELNEWKEKWAKKHLRVLKLTDFYGNPDNWVVDEYYNVLATLDKGQLARDLATLDANIVDPSGSPKLQMSRNDKSSVAKDL